MKLLECILLICKVIVAVIGVSATVVRKILCWIEQATVWTMRKIDEAISDVKSSKGYSSAVEIWQH